MAVGIHCRICKSEVHADIDKLLKKGYSKTEVIRIHKDYFKGVPEVNMFASLTNHIKAKHPPALETLKLKVNEEKKREEEVVTNGNGVTIGNKKTLEEYAQILLEEGFTPDQMKKINPAIILQGQKLLIEKDKVKTQNDLLRLSMQKMMAGMVTPGDLIDGQVIDVKEIGAGVAE